MTDIRPAKHSSHRTLEAAEFRLIFAISFIAFLVAAVVSRLLPWHHVETAQDRKQSILAEARAATNRTVPFAFMS